MENKILIGIEDYYTQKINQHGNTSLGVDWNSKASQYLRFEQLCKLVKRDDAPFSILDYGCGYAELVNYITSEYGGRLFTYLGYDISEQMLQHARALFNHLEHVTFLQTINDDEFSDYVVASGIFNVRLDLANDEEWLNYILQTLCAFDHLGGKGFSFNALTKYSDEAYMKNYLYYADPLFLFDYCKRNFSRNVALLHDYDLYEFTIIVKK